MIPYGHQDVRQSDIDAVIEVLQSDFLTTGPAVTRFEELVATGVRARYAVAMSSATGALHVACMALGLAPGDRLWTVPNTFVASANCGRYCGAEIDFVDIDPHTWNLSVPALQERLLVARRTGVLPKVLVPVHFAGQPTEQEAIYELSREFGFRVLEDASHAIGASRNGEPVGSCRYSDITVFSFHPVKIITTAEGGMAVTNDDELAARLATLRSHGITRNPTHFRENFGSAGEVPAWYYEQQALGYNYRLTDLQAALGASQFGRLDEYVDRRNMLAERYSQELAGASLQLPTVTPGNRSAFHLYVVRVGSASSGRRREIFDALRNRGIGVNLHYMPVHLQPYYRDLGFAPGQFPEAEAYGRTAITLPLYPRMSDDQQDHVIASLKDLL